jgi:CRISPR/Cas system CSM-associated protein Csm2 small subunit
MVLIEIIIELGSIFTAFTAIGGGLFYIRKFYNKSVREHEDNKKKQENIELALKRLEVLFLIHVKASDLIVAKSYDDYKLLEGNSFIDNIVKKYLDHDDSYHDEKENMEYFDDYKM